MCGITGIYNLKSAKAALNRQNIKLMTDQIAHRGPDDEGFYVEKNLALGQRRLSILDLSPLGHQPMFYDRDRLVIVFNGEIYNYLEIRKELMGKGYQFKSQTDTEVILASYQEWGTKCLDRFNGMWAFVIYDRQKNILFGARDRLGVKPLYYFIDKEKFFFASEVKAILKYPDFAAVPEERTIWEFLVTGMVDHTDRTFFKNIKQLKAGHFFLIQAKKLEIRKYWDLDLKAVSPLEDSVKNFSELFNDSIRLRLRSDVPIGTCLSGGLDSSSIVCSINEQLKTTHFEQIGRWQKTFSAAYDPKKTTNCDERGFINEVVKRTKAKSYLTFPSDRQLNNEVEKMIWHHDSPVNSMSVYAQWCVFKLASEKKVKVMLDGQGSDELLAGYFDFFGIYFLDLLRHGKIFTLVKEMRFYKKMHGESALMIFKNLFKSLANRGVFGRAIANLFRRKKKEYDIFTPDFRQKFSAFPLPQETKSYLNNSLYASVKFGLPSLLKYEDRNSMAFAIESRIPFLDYRLVEFIFSLPAKAKIRDGQTKWLLRQAMKGVIPERIRRRQDKIGFAIPGDQWLRGALKVKLEKVFNSESFLKRGYLDPQKFKALLDDFFKGHFSDYNLIWRLFCLEIWFRTFIDPSTTLGTNRKGSK